jgi:hypothetical protein
VRACTARPAPCRPFAVAHACRVRMPGHVLSQRAPGTQHVLEQYEAVRPVADALAAAYPAHIRPEHVSEAAFLAAAELHYSHALEVRRPARRPGLARARGGSPRPLLNGLREACIQFNHACDRLLELAPTRARFIGLSLDSVLCCVKRVLNARSGASHP